MYHTIMMVQADESPV